MRECMRSFPDAWSAAAIRELFAGPGVFAFLAPDGFILARAAGDEAEILTLAVMPAARRQGIGRALVLRRPPGMRKAWAPRAFFWKSGPATIAALALYTGLGSSRPGGARPIMAPRTPMSSKPSCRFRSRGIRLTLSGNKRATEKKVTRIEKLCVDKGLRMTEQRRVIARVLSGAGDHPDAEELYRRAAAIDPHISIATVYRTVKLFEDAGILERHDFRDGRARYEEMPETHHDHLIDVQTGSVIEFRNEDIEKLQRRVAEELGFELVDHRLELYGVPKGKKLPKPLIAPDS